MASDGVQCPECWCRMCKVLKTFYRTVKWGNKTRQTARRRRECENCLHCFWTVEVIEDPQNIGYPHRDSLPPEKKPPTLPPKLPNPFIKENEKFNVIHPEDRDATKPSRFRPPTTEGLG